MPSTATQAPISASLEKNAMRGQLRIAATADPQSVTRETCLGFCQNAGLTITSTVRKQVEEALERFTRSCEADVVVVFEGQPPVNGAHGRLEWAEGCDPSHHESGPVSADQRVDFYKTSHFVTVKAGQVFARIIPPTEGEYGHDLRGSVLPPKPGQPAAVRMNPAVAAADEQGNCTAAITGVLSFKNDEVLISPVLHIADSVDFSTGNILFAGDVAIAQGVRDRFVVEAAGNVEVGQLIEAATIRAGGDLVAKSGIATRGIGSIDVGRDLRAKYMTGVRAVVGRDALIQTEAIGCQLSVGGSLSIETGTLVGGQASVMTEAKFALLGSDGELLTILFLAHSPQFEQVLQSADQRITTLTGSIHTAETQLGQLRQESRPTSQQRELMMELMFQQSELQDQLNRLREKHRTVSDHYQRTRQLSLHVSKKIFPGVRLIVDDQRLDFHKPAPGPIWIGWSHDRHVIFRIGEQSAARPIAELPGITISAFKLQTGAAEHHNESGLKS